jgi:uroporphyrinogen III methyltransferase/synthase
MVSDERNRGLVLAAEQKGKVYLVGAGPGDPGLLTLRGRDCLAGAEVVIYDRLLATALLAYVPATALLIDVGKEPGKQIVSQETINQLLVEHGRAGKRVVRLKGGDPFLFGRGGEEALALKEAGISFEIVPGVSSAIAAPAYAGIPITHRGLASGVTIVTGHEMAEKAEAVDWSKLGRSSETLVILMGVAHLAQIMVCLQEQLPVGTAVAIIENGTTSRQRVIRGNITTITRLADEAGIQSPAVVVAGSVAGLAEELDWFAASRPILGRRILVTRPQAQTTKLAELIAAAGGEALCWPTIRVFPFPVDSKKLFAAIAAVDWLVFTSVNGITGCFRAMHEAGRDSRCLHRVKVAAIGAATAQALLEHGIRADLVPEAHTSEALCRELGPPARGKKLLLLRLRQYEAEVSEFPVYRVATERKYAAEITESLHSKTVDAVIFTSPSTIKGLLENIGHDLQLLCGVKVICIGPVTAKYAESQAIKVDKVADNSGDRELAAALMELFRCAGPADDGGLY